jgi:hypothetical protein
MSLSLVHLDATVTGLNSGTLIITSFHLFKTLDKNEEDTPKPQET